MGEEDGGSDRPKVNNSADRPKVYAAWSLKRVEERDFRSRAPTALQVGSKMWGLERVMFFAGLQKSNTLL
jgi:hypothetical protein